MKRIAYAVSSKATSFISDENEAREIFRTIGEDGCEFHQIINGKNIQTYNTVIFRLIGEHQLNRVYTVMDLYNIAPYDIRLKEGVYYVMYRFTGSGITKQSAVRVAMNLSIIIGFEYQWHTIPHWYAENIELINGIVKMSSVSAIIDILNYNIADAVSELQAEIANELDIEDIVGRLETGDQYDTFLNIVPEVGRPYAYVINKLGTDNAHKFFNDCYGLQFDIDDQASVKYMESGVPISTPGFSLSAGGYMADPPNGKGSPVKITDFVIYVHYRLIKEKEITYFVSLKSSKGKRSKQFEWVNTASEQRLTEILLKLGAYHFTGFKQHISLIHEYITTANVPNITSVPKYGRVDIFGKRFLVLMDGVCDLDTKNFYPKQDGLDYYFVNSTDGFVVEGSEANQTASKYIIPHFTTYQDFKFDDYMNVMMDVYADDSAYIVMMMACSIIGYTIYKPNINAPISFITGPTGSGKTTFSKFVSTMFNQTTPMSAPDTTPFALKSALTASEGLPVFLSEFRSDGKYTDQQEKILRSTFDRSLYMHGRADMSAEASFFTAQVFIEGEDVSGSGSVRSRSVIWKTRLSGRTKSNPLDILAEKESMFSSFQASYINNSSKEEYDKHIVEAREIFYKKGIETRILDNICVIYAGTMSFAKEEHKESLIEKFKSLLDIQVTDFDENGTTSKFVNIISDYLASRFAHVYVSKDLCCVVSWADITSHINKFRIKTDLALESYRENLKSVGFEFGLHPVTYKGEFDQSEEHLVKGLKISLNKAPKDFFQNKTLYKYAKDYKIPLI